MSIATVVGRDLVVVRQSLGSMEHFGDVRGAPMTKPSLRHVDAASWKVRMVAVEQVAAEGGTIRIPGMRGEWTVRGIDDGEMLLTWRPLTLDERVEVLTARWSRMFAAVRRGATR